VERKEEDVEIKFKDIWNESAETKTLKFPVI
jgi:hypothetical protein